MTNWYPESARLHMAQARQNMRAIAVKKVVEEFRDVAMPQAIVDLAPKLIEKRESIDVLTQTIVDTTMTVVLDAVNKEMPIPAPYVPMALDLGYHAYFPQYDGQTICHRHCEFLDGKPCYYDGTSLGAAELVEGFLNGGDEWLWSRLEAIYHSKFNNGAYPDLTPLIRPHPHELN
jgi:hypothetical protein